MASKRGFITVPLITSLLKLKCSYSRISQSILHAYVSVCSHSRIPYAPIPVSHTPYASIPVSRKVSRKHTYPVCSHSVSRKHTCAVSPIPESRMLPFPYPVCSHSSIPYAPITVSRLLPFPYLARTVPAAELFSTMGNKLYDYADDSTLVAVVTSPGERVCVTGAESLISASTLWNFSGPQDLCVELSILME